MSLWVIELRALAWLALPVIIAQVGHMMTGVVDTYMVGHLGAVELAAVTLGNNYRFSVSWVLIGALFALDPIVSQAFGANRLDRCRQALREGLVFASLLALPMVAFWLLVDPTLRALGQDEALIPLASEYVYWLIPGALPMLWFFALRTTIQAIGSVWTIAVAMLLANGVNYVLDLWFIYGQPDLMIPPMGVRGAAIATALAWWFVFGLLWLCGELSGTLPKLRRAGPVNPVRWSAIATIATIGLPIGLMQGLEVWAFSFAGAIMGWFERPDVVIAAHGIALMLASLSFMVPLGVAIAAAVRVGQAIGRRDMPAARRTAVVSLLCGMAVMSLSAFAFATWPEWLGSCFSSDPHVIAMVATLLPLAALFQLFDGTQAVGFGVLRGSGDTAIPTLINLIGYYVIALPLGCWLGFEWHGQGLALGPWGVWLGLAIGLMVIAAGLVWRIHRRFSREIQPLEDLARQHALTLAAAQPEFEPASR